MSDSSQMVHFNVNRAIRACRTTVSGSVDKKQPIEHLLDGIKATNFIDYYEDNRDEIHVK
jgi:hypothetical protein